MPVTYDLNPATTALVVIDMTNDFLVEGSPMEVPGGPAIIDPIDRLAERCRASGMPVIFTRHLYRADGSDFGVLGDLWPAEIKDADGRPLVMVAGTEGIEVHPALGPHDGDIVIDKHRSSAFFERELDSVLREHGIRTLLITGMATNGCCYSTALDAGFRGYQVVFLADATATTALPDLGYGTFTADECQRMALSLVALASGEVATTEDVLRRLGAPVPVG